jgi:hypothetical protein
VKVHNTHRGDTESARVLRREQRVGASTVAGTGICRGSDGSALNTPRGGFRAGALIHSVAGNTKSVEVVTPRAERTPVTNLRDKRVYVTVI